MEKILTLRIKQSDIERRTKPLTCKELNVMCDMGVGAMVTFFFDYTIPVSTQHRLVRNFIYRRKKNDGENYVIKVDNELNYIRLLRKE